MARLPRIVPEDRRQTLLLFRWLIVLTCLLLMVYGPKGLRFAGAGYLLTLFFFATNVGLALLPRRFFRQTSFVASLFAVDLVLVSAAVHLSGGAGTELFLLYFFVVFAALPVGSIAFSPTVAIFATGFYALITVRASGAASLLEANFLIKIPFFFLLATFASLLSHQTRHLKRQREEYRMLSEEVSRRLERATKSKQKLYEDLLTLYGYNESILNSIDTGVIVIDLDGTVTAFNRAAETITGVNRDDVLFSSVSASKPLMNFGSLMKQSPDSPVRREEIRLETASGETKVIGISTYPLEQRKRGIVGVIAVFADLTQIRELEEQVKRSEKLAILGEMAASVAHEVRNPLSSVQGMSDMIVAETKEEDDHGRYARIISKEARRIDRTIQEILTFSRNKKLEKNPVDINSLVEDVLDSVRMKADEAQVAVNWTPGADIPEISADEHQLRKVISNLMINSIQALGKGGNVAVLTERDEDGVSIVVNDNGPGIPSAVQRKIFNPFFSTKGKGTGLGLAIVNKIVEDHDGTIHLDSVEGMGTKFTVWLPSKAPTHVRETDCAAPKEEKPTVLVADDDASLREFYKELLEKSGHKVVLAKDGQDAIRKAVGGTVDLLILDIKMPMIDGIAVMDHLNKMIPELPIIVSSGYDKMKDDYSFKSSNVVAYFTKPVDISEFQKRVDDVLKKNACA